MQMEVKALERIHALLHREHAQVWPSFLPLIRSFRFDLLIRVFYLDTSRLPLRYLQAAMFQSKYSDLNMGEYGSNVQVYGLVSFCHIMSLP